MWFGYLGGIAVFVTVQWFIVRSLKNRLPWKHLPLFLLPLLFLSYLLLSVDVSLAFQAEFTEQIEFALTRFVTAVLVAAWSGFLLASSSGEQRRVKKVGESHESRRKVGETGYYFEPE